MRKLAIAIAICAGCGCRLADALWDTDPTDEPSTGCSEKLDGTNPSVTQVPSPDQALPATTDTIVRGAISNRPDDVTVFKVLVAGIAANNDGDDYASFDATIPIATLQALARSAVPPDSASLPVDVATNCSDTLSPSDFVVPVVPTAATSLAFQTPSVASIPANGGAPAQLVLTADGSDTGMAVALTTTLGALDGVATETVTLEPQGAGSGACAATPAADSIACAQLLGAGRAGIAVISARAANTPPVTAAVTLFGPPTIAPSGVSLVDGQPPVSVTVTDPGATGSPAFTCFPTQGEGLTIDGSGASFTVTASSPTAGTSATLTCADAFGQTTVATYSVPK